MAEAHQRVSAAELARMFQEDIYKLPDGMKIKACLQCGTCGGSCPTAYAMDYTPREIFAAFRAGMLDRVVESKSVWMCASCYQCTVRCPAGIKITDVMYELKRLGTKYGLHPKDVTVPALSATFVETVDKYGRQAEFEMMRKFYFRTGIFKAIKNLGLALKMRSRGRLALSGKKIKGRDDLLKIGKKVDEMSEA
jgi:heterodisulfide reductase subunit C